MQIKIQMLRPKLRPVFLPPPIEGVTMGRPRGEISNGVGSDTLFIIIDVVLPIVGNLSAGIISNWIFDRVKQYESERIAINGKEVTNETEFKRVISEEIDIGKND